MEFYSFIFKNPQAVFDRPPATVLQNGLRASCLAVKNTFKPFIFSHLQIPTDPVIFLVNPAWTRMNTEESAYFRPLAGKLQMT